MPNDAGGTDLQPVVACVISWLTFHKMVQMISTANDCTFFNAGLDVTPNTSAVVDCSTKGNTYEQISWKNYYTQNMTVLSDIYPYEVLGEYVEIILHLI